MSEFLEFAANHWLLVAGIIGVFILIVMEEITAFSGSKYMLDPEAAAIFIQKGGKIIDIRDKEYYNQGHITDAKWVKYETIINKPETIISKDGKTLIYCDNGTKSAELSELLRSKHGFKVHFIEGGLNNWKDSGFTVKK